MTRIENRNILTESASIVSNNESNQTITRNEGDSWKTRIANTKTNTINIKKFTSILRSRSAKKSASPPKMSTCAWCSVDKPILNYISRTSSEEKQFCSEMCITEFRKTVKRGACKMCGNIIKLTVIRNKEYCSLDCIERIHLKNGEKIITDN